MSGLDASRAYEEFDIPEAVHATVLQEASSGRPWTPEAVTHPGVEIDEDIYAEGVLEADPREKQDRHDLLLDGRLERYRENISRGRSKWDVVLTERDFYSHPDEFDFDESINHNRNVEDSLRQGDGDLILLDLDRYEAHMVEVKPHEGYADGRALRDSSDPEVENWRGDWDLDMYEAPSGNQYRQVPDNRTGNTVNKKVRNWREAWKSIAGELENDWNVFQPEFVFGSNVLNASSLSQNPEYALPPQYDQKTGYALATEQGYEMAESSQDMEALNEFFFRGGISGLVEGERPEIERKSVL